MPKVIKPSDPFVIFCWVSVLTTFFCAATNLFIDGFYYRQFQKRKMMGDGFMVLLLPVCFEQ